MWGRYDLLVLPPSFPYGGVRFPFFPLWSFVCVGFIPFFFLFSPCFLFFPPCFCVC